MGIDVCRDTPQPYTFRLLARLPLKDVVDLTLPHLEVNQAYSAEQWLGIIGPGLDADKAVGLVKSQDVAQDLRLWPGEAGRASSRGTVWQIKDASWSLKLQVRTSDASPSLTVLHAQEDVLLSDCRHWSHQTEFQLAAREETDIRLVIPAAARLQALVMDDAQVTPRAAGPQTYALKVGAGVHVLMAYWYYLEQAEPLESPHLGGVYLAGAPATPLQGRLLVPAGHEAVVPTGEPVADLPRYLLSATRAHIGVTRFLAQQLVPLAPALIAAQKKFWWNLRRAELELSYFGKDRDKTAYAQSLMQLRKENERLLQEKKLEGLRAQAEKYSPDLYASQVPIFSRSEQGKPIYWQLADAARNNDQPGG